jgi:hypothetical protein
VRLKQTQQVAPNCAAKFGSMINIPRIGARIVAVGSCLLFAAGAEASLVHMSLVSGRYFRIADNRSYDYEVANSWRWWLRAHRAIRADPELSEKYSDMSVDLSRAHFKSGREKATRLGLSAQQIERQPDHVYTLHVASFQNGNELRSFLRAQWIAKGAGRKGIYKNTPKGLTFSVSGDINTKNDYLYTRQAPSKGRTISLRYGVYESTADADADRKVLERTLGTKLRVMRERPTVELVRRVLLQGVEGTRLQRWEIASPAATARRDK